MNTKQTTQPSHQDTFNEKSEKSGSSPFGSANKIIRMLKTQNRAPLFLSYSIKLNISTFLWAYTTRMAPQRPPAPAPVRKKFWQLAVGSLNSHPYHRFISRALVAA